MADEFKISPDNYGSEWWAVIESIIAFEDKEEQPGQ